MKAYLDRWCAFFDSDWRIHEVYVNKFKGKRIGVITVCGDPDVRTADPIVHSFKMTCTFMGLKWVGVVQASATEKGEISQNEKIKKAYNLGKKGGIP